MLILSIFLLLGVIEYAVVYFYWSKVSDVVEIGTEVGKAAPMKYKRIPLKIVSFIKRFKKLILIPISIILFINFIISLVLGGIGMLIISLF